MKRKKYDFNLILKAVGKCKKIAIEYVVLDKLNEKLIKPVYKNLSKRLKNEEA